MVWPQPRAAALAHLLIIGLAVRAASAAGPAPHCPSPALKMPVSILEGPSQRRSVRREMVVHGTAADVATASQAFCAAHSVENEMDDCVAAVSETANRLLGEKLRATPHRAAAAPPRLRRADGAPFSPPLGPPQAPPPSPPRLRDQRPIFRSGCAIPTRWNPTRCVSPRMIRRRRSSRRRALPEVLGPFAGAGRTCFEAVSQLRTAPAAWCAPLNRHKYFDFVCRASGRRPRTQARARGPRMDSTSRRAAALAPLVRVHDNALPPELLVCSRSSCPTCSITPSRLSTRRRGKTRRRWYDYSHSGYLPLDALGAAGRSAVEASILWLRRYAFFGSGRPRSGLHRGQWWIQMKDQDTGVEFHYDKDECVPQGRRTCTYPLDGDLLATGAARPTLGRTWGNADDRDGPTWRGGPDGRSELRGRPTVDEVRRRFGADGPWSPETARGAVAPARGDLVYPRLNRHAVFDGALYHGVVSGIDGAAPRAPAALPRGAPEAACRGADGRNQLLDAPDQLVGAPPFRATRSRSPTRRRPR